MKKIFTQFFLFVALLAATANLSAQTYNGGTWYSLYETATKTNVNALDKNFGEISGVFAPAESITFQYKKYTWGSIKGEVRVYNKKSDGNWEYKGAANYSDSEDWNTTSEILLDANITAIRYRMESGTGVQVKNTRDAFSSLKNRFANTGAGKFQ